MEIGAKLKEARVKEGFTQEYVAEAIQVSRQTISNWENEKSYPDILSVIKLSDLYHISLDKLLKEDKKMIEHLEESTDTVKSNRKLIFAIALNILLLLLFLILNILHGFSSQNRYLTIISASLCIISTCVVFYQIINKV